jgi:hypothetical protein
MFYLLEREGSQAMTSWVLRFVMLLGASAVCYSMNGVVYLVASYGVVYLVASYHFHILHVALTLLVAFLPVIVLLLTD